MAFQEDWIIPILSSKTLWLLALSSGKNSKNSMNAYIFIKVEGMEKHLEKIADLEDRVKRIENILFKAS